MPYPNADTLSGLALLLMRFQGKGN